MTIEFVTGNMKPTEIKLDKSMIVCFPSVANKKYSPKELSYVKELYEQYPKASYYQQHSSTGKRAQLGSVDKTSLTSDGSSFIYNIYIKLYPNDIKPYFNDNGNARLEHFQIAMGEIAENSRIHTVYIQPPSTCPDDLDQYYQIMDDFANTYNLQFQREITIKIFTGEIDKKPTLLNNNQAKSKPKLNKLKISPKSNKMIATKKATEFKLIFRPEQVVNEQPLYEVDLQVYNNNPSQRESGQAEDIKSHSATGTMSYFPKANRWLALANDPKLQRLAEQVDEKLGDISDSQDIFPPVSDIFNAFSYSETEPKVVILGQDPYHKKGQAHGLSFSVQHGVTVPPSLRNIYMALENDPDVEFTIPEHGCLESWARQGVILLNASLTVKESEPNSHKEIWKSFTGRLIQLLSEKYSKIVFVLWGNDAKAKKKLIATNKGHKILEFKHPSPLAGSTFATECRHFSEINRFLVENRKEPIDWRL